MNVNLKDVDIAGKIIVVVGKKEEKDESGSKLNNTVLINPNE